MAVGEVILKAGAIDMDPWQSKEVAVFRWLMRHSKIAGWLVVLLIHQGEHDGQLWNRFFHGFQVVLKLVLASSSKLVTWLAENPPID